MVKAANLREETMRSLTAHRARTQEERKMLFTMKRVRIHVCTCVSGWSHVVNSLVGSHFVDMSILCGVTCTSGMYMHVKVGRVTCIMHVKVGGVT